MKKYHRRVTAIDVAVYSVSGVMAGAGIVLSSVTMIAPIAIPIAISAATTVSIESPPRSLKNYHHVRNENSAITQ